MLPRKANQPELTREMILSAAGEIFVKKGYQHVSMRQIAAALGYSHGSLYYYFKNKAELFSALVDDYFSLLEDTLDRILEKEIGPYEKMLEILKGYIQFGLNYQNHYEIMFLVKDEEVRYFINEKPNIVYQKFAQSLYALSEGKLSIKEIWSIFLALHGFVTHYIGHVVTYEDVKEAANFHVKFLLNDLE